VSGFGAVFTDVDTAVSTTIEYFDVLGTSLGKFTAGVASGGLSFVGVSFDAGERVALVRITSGTGSPSFAESSTSDAVVMDDFIYSEPQAVTSVQSSQPIIRTAAGFNAGSIQLAVDQFRADLGGIDNKSNSSAIGGRREINWDGVPDDFASPNSLPGEFFNTTVPRGVRFSTPGSGFQVSADSSNPSGTPVEFANLNSRYPASFVPFSPERLFTPVGSNVTDVTFFVPGTNTPAVVSGFGAVFSDVNFGDFTSLQYFDVNGNSLGAVQVPVSARGSSFAGMSVPAGQGIATVRITTGNRNVGSFDESTANTVGQGRFPDEFFSTQVLTFGQNDVVVMDDFILGEPRAAQQIPRPPDDRRVINQLVLANLQAIFAQPLPPQIAVAQIIQVADANGDGFNDATAIVGLRVPLRRGRMGIMFFQLTFDGVSPSGGLVGAPVVLWTM
jgi:hypothetical protein